MKNQIRSEEDELFVRWKQEYNLKSTEFAQDGVVNSEEWENNPNKTLFILKETNGCDDLRSHLRWEGSPRTWANVARWQYGIINWSKNVNWSNVEDFGRNREKRKKYLHQICAINLKKQPGGKSTNGKKLEKAFFEKNFKYFTKQLNLYKDVKYIICCGRDVKNILLQTDVFKECFGYDYLQGRGQRYNDVWTYKLEGRV